MKHPLGDAHEKMRAAVGARRKMEGVRPHWDGLDLDCDHPGCTLPVNHRGLHSPDRIPGH